MHYLDIMLESSTALRHILTRMGLFSLSHPSLPLSPPSPANQVENGSQKFPDRFNLVRGIPQGPHGLSNSVEISPIVQRTSLNNENTLHVSTYKGFTMSHRRVSPW